MKIQFPSDFKFGVAESDLQTIGEKYTREYENSQPTMWNNFAKNSGKCYQNQNSDEGIDRYHLWKEDIELMKQLGVKHYRISVSIARILTDKGMVNDKAVSWYQDYFKAIKKAGIKLYVTLYHWELPQIMSEQGGWKNRKTTELLVKHAQAVVKNLGEYIDEYFILNEPRCSGLISYYEGVHAPGETNLASALLAVHHLLLGQGMVVADLQTKYKNLKLNTVLNIKPSYAYSGDEKDILAAKYADGYNNRLFLDPIFKGEYPPVLVDLLSSYFPKVTSADMKIIHVGDKLNALGCNFYRGVMVKYDEKSPFKHTKVSKKEVPTTALGWDIFLPPYYPEGLYDILQQVYFGYRDYGLKSMYITENGTAVKSIWDGKSKIINDQKRIDYMNGHLTLIHKAIRRGVPIEGYFFWTFMDNYEWAEGYRDESRFGSIYIDRKTMKRVLKKSALWYSKLSQTKQFETTNKSIVL